MRGYHVFVAGSKHVHIAAVYRVVHGHKKRKGSGVALRVAVRGGKIGSEYPPDIVYVVNGRTRTDYQNVRVKLAGNRRINRVDNLIAVSGARRFRSLYIPSQLRTDSADFFRGVYDGVRSHVVDKFYYRFPCFILKFLAVNFERKEQGNGKKRDETGNGLFHGILRLLVQ